MLAETRKQSNSVKKRAALRSRRQKHCFHKAAWAKSKDAGVLVPIPLPQDGGSPGVGEWPTEPHQCALLSDQGIIRGKGKALQGKALTKLSLAYK